MLLEIRGTFSRWPDLQLAPSRSHLLKHIRQKVRQGGQRLTCRGYVLQKHEKDLLRCSIPSYHNRYQHADHGWVNRSQVHLWKAERVSWGVSRSARYQNSHSKRVRQLRGPQRSLLSWHLPLLRKASYQTRRLQHYLKRVWHQWIPSSCGTR